MFIPARTVKNMIKRNARRHAALSLFGMLVLTSNMVMASGDSTRGHEVYEQDCQDLSYTRCRGCAETG